MIKKSILIFFLLIIFSGTCIADTYSNSYNLTEGNNTLSLYPAAFDGAFVNSITGSADIVEDDGTYNILKTGQIVIGNPPPPPKFPIEFFGLMLVIIYVLGMCVILRGVFLPYKALNKGDVYLRGSIFLISLSLTLFSSIGIYITKDDVGYILGLDEYWIIVPFSIAVVSLFATVYAWLSVFGKKKKEEI